MNNQQPQQSPQGPANATLVAFFRHAIEAGPDTILDDYLDHNNPFTFDFSEVQERQRDGSFDTAFDGEVARRLQEEHDGLVETWDSPAMIAAARIANGMDDPDGRPTIGRETIIREITFGRLSVTETTRRPILADAAGDIGPLTGTVADLVSPDHDDTKTVDVVLYEEGRERVVHINKRVFGFFQRLRPAMGTLEGYHPETRFEEYDLPGFAAEHAELLARHGVDAMIEGAIAAQVFNDRFTGKRTTLSDNYDNHDDPRDGSRSSDAYDEEALRERVEELEDRVDGLAGALADLLASIDTTWKPAELANCPRLTAAIERARAAKEEHDAAYDVESDREERGLDEHGTMGGNYDETQGRG